MIGGQLRFLSLFPKFSSVGQPSVSSLGAPWVHMLTLHCAPINIRQYMDIQFFFLYMSETQVQLLSIQVISVMLLPITLYLASGNHSSTLCSMCLTILDLDFRF